MGGDELYHGLGVHLDCQCEEAGAELLLVSQQQHLGAGGREGGRWRRHSKEDGGIRKEDPQDKGTWLMTGSCSLTTL